MLLDSLVIELKLVLLNVQLQFCFGLGNKEQRKDAWKDGEPSHTKFVITGLTPGPYIIMH